MGMSPVWTFVADAVGYETFLTMWTVMSSNREFMDGRNRITIPDISMLHLYQRNLLVRDLARQGYSPKQIRNEVARRAGLALTQWQIQHIIRDHC